MEENKRVSLSKEQKIAKLKQQIKKLQNEDKIKERKDRTRNLVQIGAVVASTISHVDFISYLQTEQNKLSFINYLKEYPFIKNNNK